ncbi:MAG: hypothetical protein PHX18_02860 [Candidatus Gastranaerophilales bacterium]|nr:hypothetical protein [Candidatus Gastranaerophilales bacterium]
MKLIQETAFFRQLSGLAFVRDYAEKMFANKQIIRILDGACSTGEETWSLAMLFQDFPKKVQITGFDIGKSAIEEAKKGVFPISKIKLNPYLEDFYDAYKDSFLSFKPISELQEYQKKCKELFDSFFEPTSVPKERISLMEKIKLKLLGKYLPKKETNYYKVRPEKALLCNFVEGDIVKPDNLAKDGQVDIFLFRNALYHLITDDLPSKPCRLPFPKEESQKILEDLFRDIRRKLSKNGIFVLGNNEMFQTLDDGLVQKVLQQTGFMPVFRDNPEFAAVWQKV